MLERLPRSEAADISLTALLLVQLATQFVVLPASALSPNAHGLLDVSHLLFAAICVTVLTRSRVLQGALLLGLILVAGGPWLVDGLAQALRLRSPAIALISATAFVFNAMVTGIVMQHVFGPGPVTFHRLQGAVLIYLNVAALFAIAFGLLQTVAPGAVMASSGPHTILAPGQEAAAFSYFSLATITTTGYGDLLPVHPFARALSNLEAVFGQLFPATVLARLVGLNLFHAQTRQQER